jgi:hypothetical protein
MQVAVRHRLEARFWLGHDEASHDDARDDEAQSRASKIA